MPRQRLAPLPRQPPVPPQPPRQAQRRHPNGSWHQPHSNPRAHRRTYANPSPTQLRRC
ncbi:MAG TPA: hypothetical protein VI322_00885 [Candidatus Saccharimonadia bacterium]